MPFLTIGTATTQGPGGDRNDHDQGQLRLQPEAHAAVDYEQRTGIKLSWQWRSGTGYRRRCCPNGPSPFPIGGATGRAQSRSPELEPCAVLLRECDPRRSLPRESSPHSQEPEGPCSAEWPITTEGKRSIRRFRTTTTVIVEPRAPRHVATRSDSVSLPHRPGEGPSPVSGDPGTL